MPTGQFFDRSALQAHKEGGWGGRQEQQSPHRSQGARVAVRNLGGTRRPRTALTGRTQARVPSVMPRVCVKPRLARPPAGFPFGAGRPA